MTNPNDMWSTYIEKYNCTSVFHTRWHFKICLYWLSKCLRTLFQTVFSCTNYSKAENTNAFTFSWLILVVFQYFFKPNFVTFVINLSCGSIFYLKSINCSLKYNMTQDPSYIRRFWLGFLTLFERYCDNIMIFNVKLFISKVYSNLEI